MSAASAARAAVYEGTVRHRRFGSVSREFAPRLFLTYLDVEALPEALDELPFWSARRRAPVHFSRRDFFDGSDRPLAPAVRDLVESRLGRRPEGPVHLLAQLRTFGWLFNPLVVYYCWTPDATALDALVLEVTNTPWHERQWYVFDARHDVGGGTTAKAMHVSPFLPMDVDYRVTWNTPGPTLDLRVVAERAGEPVFEAELALRRVALDRRTALSLLAKYPLLPMRVSGGIYTQATRLVARRVPFHSHPERRADAA